MKLCSNRLSSPAARLSVCALLALAPALSAQTVREVPRDHPTIQAAIDASSPGDLVLVRGGVHDGPIAIDRALTLMGDPRARIQPPYVTTSVQPPAIELAGSGAGTVTLVNLEIGGLAYGNYNSYSSPGIQGGGFAELHLFECAVEGPDWIILTGIASGSPALATDVADVLVERCTLRGANSDNDGCYGNGPPGPAGIDAPSSNVVVLDSLVRGGGSGTICGPGGGEFCPVAGGAGGPGIVADTVWEAESDVQGGAGALYFANQQSTVPCGQAPSGAAVVATDHTILLGGLTKETRLRLGKPWRLSWNTPSASSILFLSSAAQLTPTQLPAGAVFLDLSRVFLTQSFPSGAGSFELRIPLDVDLLGQEIAAQVRGDTSGWTRPVIDVVRPGRARASDPP